MNIEIRQPREMRRPPINSSKGDKIVHGNFPLWWVLEVARGRAATRDSKQVVRRHQGAWLIQDVR